MKLAFASTAAALILTTAASAVTPEVITDFRAAATGALGQVTTGEQETVSIEAYTFGDGQSRAALAQDEVKVTTFESAASAQPVTDVR